MREAITAALRDAMKARDAGRTGTLRLISAALKERDIAARGQGREAASGDELVAALAKMVRQREESAKLYDDAGRPELAGKERAEIEVIRGFMPTQMGDDELLNAVQGAVKEAGATSPRDMGRVMAILKERYAGQMELGKAGSVVRSILG